MTITAQMVKELRERTGAGMMECKKALKETSGDIEAAIVAMRKRGQAKAAKRAGKVASEGIIVVKAANDNKYAVIVEINSETDFVARDVNFTGFANKVAETALANRCGDLETLLTLPYADGQQTIEGSRQELVAKIGENVQIRRVVLLESSAYVGSYLHGGRIGVLISLDKSNADLAKDIAMHIAASNPQAIDEHGVPAELIAKEKEIYAAQAKETGKPDNIIEKMVEGRIAKYLKEVCLVSQPFVKNPELTVGRLLQDSQAKVTNFIRFEVGEGIEKQEADFAKEVQAQVQGSA